ncbi:MAG: preprotein translocase subunit SecA [Rickettsiales bacterium]
MNYIAKKIFGSVNERNLKIIRQDVAKINDLEPSISALTNEELKNKTAEFKYKLSQGQSLDDILHEAFAVVREASKRVLSMRHFDVQLVGGIVLHQGKIAEMRTGEGKTLVATLPSYLNALSGKGVHIVTVNDYLAKRDSVWMGKIHEFLGLSVGCLTNDLIDEERKKAYDCDITYATNNELGFDYLRDNMKYDEEEMVQRRNFAIVDEVDSILIDEARTPLIISGPTNDNSKLYELVNNLILKLNNDDFVLEEKERNVFLNDNGIEKIEKILQDTNQISANSSLYDPHNIALVHHINQALKAHKLFKNEIDYIVKDGSVIIIDEFTGRMQEGRRFSEGLHQALEAKERIRVRNENQTLASISFQNYFRLYDKLSGMTGTASNEAVEFEETYNLRVVEIPPNRIFSRIDEDDEIYKTEAGKYDAILKAVKEAHDKKQPILLGTVSIEKSEYLSHILKKHKLPHNVLNAKYHDREAEIIAQAGVPSAITIATNMAGRGTDIMLGGNIEMMIDGDEDPDKIQKIKAKIEADKKTVIEAGGLFVIGTERHESRRIDNQLRGRSGRQGDIGKSKFYLSLEDDLLRIFGSDKLKNVLSRFGLKDDEAIFHPMITKTLQNAQKKVEARNYEIRKNLLKYDDVVNFQRKNIYELRNELIKSSDISAKIQKIMMQLNQDFAEDFIPKNAYKEQWELDSLDNELQRIYGFKFMIKDFAQNEDVDFAKIINHINQLSQNHFATKEQNIGSQIIRKIEKQIFLITLDSHWKEHLHCLDKLRQGINLRAYAQKDPLIEFKKEAYAIFEQMLLDVEEQVISRLATVEFSANVSDDGVDIIAHTPKQKTFETREDFSSSALASASSKIPTAPIKNKVDPKERDPRNPSSWGVVARNEPCPCGSGKKYKNCHGA